MSPNDCVHRTAYTFGSQNAHHFGTLVLAANGRVRSYDHPNERAYTLTGDLLEMRNDEGAVTSRMRWHQEANVFLPADRARLYLLPLLSLDEPAPTGRQARIIVNTLPKSGTYLMAEVLQRIGYRSVDLHLHSTDLDDNRGVPAKELHYDAAQRRVPCPPRVVAELLAPGEFAVGHIDSVAELNAIRNAGVHVISTIRDLRAVAVSFFRYRRDKVGSVHPGDAFWHSLEPRAAFHVFLGRAADCDLPAFANFSRLMTREAQCLLRFEDLVACQIDPAARAALDAIEPGLADDILQALPEALGQPTSTYSGRLSATDEYESPEAEALYEAIGYLEANREAGYERPAPPAEACAAAQ